MVHFPVINTSLPAETLPWKMQLPFFSSFAALMLKRILQQIFRVEYWTNIHVLWNLLPGYSVIRWCNICCFELSIVHVGMMMLWMHALFSYIIRTCALCLKSHSLRLKSDFITLSCFEGLAALSTATEWNKGSNEACSLMMGNVGCNHITFIWKFELASNLCAFQQSTQYHTMSRSNNLCAFQQSTQYHTMFRSKACENVTVIGGA